MPRPNPGSACLPLMPLLKRTARAFYLTIAVLPRGMRRPVGLAYLLARGADTIADTAALPAERRLALLAALRRRVGGDAAPLPSLAALALPTASDSERALLAALPSLAALDDLEPSDRRLVSNIVSRLADGMEFDLRRFPPGEKGCVRSLADAAELDRYTYLVAGCVGEFWTDIAMAHTRALRGWDRRRMAALGVRFGKALQLTNILRDAPADMAMGRSYIPKRWFADAGSAPRRRDSARAALDRGLALALDHYEGAERYLLSIPRRCVRLRLAAAWPLLMGLATLALLSRRDSWLDADTPARVSRRWVYGMMATSAAAVCSNRALAWWIRRLRRGVKTRAFSPASAR